MITAFAIADVLACPRCSGRVATDENNWRCNSCQLDFPVIGKLPWLYENPPAALADWQAKIKGEVQQLETAAEHIKFELKTARLLASTERRLQKQLQAHVEQRKHLEKLLAPVIAAAFDGTGSLALSEVLKGKMPSALRLTGYYQNIHRDWGWDDELPARENVLSCDLVSQVIGTQLTGKICAVLGAGGCRLPYDLHRRLNPAQTILVDINPLLFYAAKRIISGQTVPLYEFPLAPRDSDSYAVLRRCQAPTALKNNWHFLLADAMTPPFQAGSIDIVLTPWLIDVVPQNLPDFAARLNQLLKPGGLWINFGSTVFNHHDFSRRYSLTEVFEIIHATGFKVTAHETAVIPYMQSPASNHSRLERVHAFTSCKVAERVPPPPYRYLPDWLLDTTKTVPRTEGITAFQITHAIYADVASLIDGQRSLEEITVLMTQKYPMPLADAKQGLIRFLTTFYEQQQLGQPF